MTSPAEELSVPETRSNTQFSRLAFLWITGNSKTVTVPSRPEKLEFIRLAKAPAVADGRAEE
jgi:hypothetical protein